MKPLKSGEIYGNWATLLLTTEKDGTLNYKKLSEEMDVLIASRPNGIYSNGTAGEFYAQTEEEFDKISEMLAGKCENSGIPFQIGVSHMSPQISLERLKRIKHLKPGAIQLILPDWFPVSLEEAINFLQKMESEADGISLILYNPPHAKKILNPEEWEIIKKQIPSLEGLKVFDQNADPVWFEKVRKHAGNLSVFVPGHRLISGIRSGASGAYSNMACLNPLAAQKWYELLKVDLTSAMELEDRINLFMSRLIAPFITENHYPNHACDRFMALMGGWADVGEALRWPYQSIPVHLVEPVRKEGIGIIPEFFEKYL